VTGAGRSAGPAIRPARPADRAAIEALVRAAYAVYEPRMGRPPGPVRDDSAARIAAGEAHVIEEAGALLGLVVLEERDGRFLLDNVAVARQAQGRGLGRALIGFAEMEARRRGFEAIDLYTNEAMHENIALYARLGYEETRRVAEKGYARVYMRKRL